MCETCVGALKKWWPNATEEQGMVLLWNATAYPMGGPETIERQLREASEETGQDVGLALAFADIELDVAMSCQLTRHENSVKSPGAKRYWRERHRHLNLRAARMCRERKAAYLAESAGAGGRAG